MKEGLDTFARFVGFLKVSGYAIKPDCHVTELHQEMIPILRHVYILGTMATRDLAKCCLCLTILLIPSKRHVLSLLSPANTEVRMFLVDVVGPGHCFSDSVSYVCHMLCFSNLTKAVKHHAALQKLMTAMRAPEAKCISDGTTQTHTPTDISTLQSHLPQHLTETSFFMHVHLFKIHYNYEVQKSRNLSHDFCKAAPR